MKDITQNPLAGLDGGVSRKVEHCEQLLREMGRVVVACSGGTDSVLLAALAVRALGRDNVLAVVGVSASLAQSELAEARRLLDALAVRAEYVDTGEMDDPRFAANAPDRCFHCKSELFARLNHIARQGGYDAVLTGANADDTGDYRPGLRAGEACGVRNPLLEAGLTKADIRTVSRALELPTWDKPASACLASRIPYGRPITAATLKRIEKGEALLREIGFRHCRLRDHDTVARIEVAADRIADLVAARDRIGPALQELGYHYVTVDLQGYRTGSLNETL